MSKFEKIQKHALARAQAEKPLTILKKIFLLAQSVRTLTRRYKDRPSIIILDIDRFSPHVSRARLADVSIGMKMTVEICVSNSTGCPSLTRSLTQRDNCTILFVVKADRLNLSSTVGNVLNPLMASRISSCEYCSRSSSPPGINSDMTAARLLLTMRLHVNNVLTEIAMVTYRVSDFFKAQFLQILLH